MYQLQGETDDDQNECVTDEVLVAVVHDRVGKPPCGQERNTRTRKRGGRDNQVAC